jgi:hypothetical protein
MFLNLAKNIWDNFSIRNLRKSGIKIEIYAKINQNYPEIVKLTPNKNFGKIFV